MKKRLYVIKFIGYLCIAYSLTLIPPLCVSLWLHDAEFDNFISVFFLMLLFGAICWLPFRRTRSELHRTDGFLVVAVFWMLLSSISAMPFITGGHLHWLDALFEATSGFTTTGATIITDLEQLDPSLLYYRQQLQFLGGMGLIVLAIAIIPVLGVGGFQLYRVETPGPMKDDKLTPRLVHAIRSLCLIYFVLTFLCAAGYWLTGMTFFNALQHSFATVSTGGFSIHNESIGYYDNYAIYLIAVIFMLLGAINFGIHFHAILHKKPLMYLADTETRSYLKIIFYSVLFITISLYLGGHYQSFYETLNLTLFTVTSVITSTGFGVTDFTLWPAFLPPLVIFLSFIGGSGGSTAGGIKVIRILTLFKVGAQQMFFIIHPRARRPVRVGERIIDQRIIQSIWGFFAVYASTYAIFTLLMMMAGLDQVSAFAAVAATLNNLGPGLGTVSVNFAATSDMAKWLGIAAMLLGRLEIFTFLVLLTPAYWRR